MDRRNFIKATGLTLAAALMHDSLFSAPKDQRRQLINYPDKVSAIIDDQTVQLASTENEIWTYQDVLVSLENTGAGIAVTIQAPKVKLSSVTLQWKTPNKSSSLILNELWERT